VAPEVAKYAVDRINGKKPPEVARAIEARDRVNRSVVDLMRMLGPKDFELLVDLVFSTSGWRRLGVVGGTEKTTDIALELPSTRERAFVQVKSHTDSAELADYVSQMKGFDERVRMFYVYHSWRSGKPETDSNRVVLVGPDRLAEMVLDAGLVNWLIRKTS
jgi:hypothetical protein